MLYKYICTYVCIWRTYTHTYIIFKSREKCIFFRCLLFSRTKIFDVLLKLASNYEKKTRSFDIIYSPKNKSDLYQQPFLLTFTMKWNEYLPPTIAQREKYFQIYSIYSNRCLNISNISLHSRIGLCTFHIYHSMDRLHPSIWRAMRTYRDKCKCTRLRKICWLSRSPYPDTDCTVLHCTFTYSAAVEFMARQMGKRFQTPYTYACRMCMLYVYIPREQLKYGNRTKLLIISAYNWLLCTA